MENLRALVWEDLQDAPKAEHCYRVLHLHTRDISTYILHMFVAVHRRYVREYTHLERTVSSGFLRGRGWGCWAEEENLF